MAPKFSVSSMFYVLPLLASLVQGADNKHIDHHHSAEANAAVPVSQYLNSFSIEFQDLPHFAGNVSSPNQYSINLLSNFAHRTGIMPMIRIGGTSQDDAVYDASQKDPVVTTGTTVGTQRARVTIGPSFFESYGVFPNTSYITGINLATNGSAGTATRKEEFSAISKALGDSLQAFEIGNEPDLFQHWNRRPSSWGVKDYVSEWEAAAKLAESTLSGSTLSYFAPSFAGTDNTASSDAMGPAQAFKAGLRDKTSIKTLSGHNYMASATGSGVSLQKTLMNHSAIVKSISNHVTLASNLKAYSSAKYVMGETNSLSGGGASGLSDVYGAALWAADYALWQATQNIQRVHFHQSSVSPYASWLPSPPTTCAPYYGNMLVAAAVGSSGNTKISYLDLGSNDGTLSGYQLYDDGSLARIVVLNMVEYTSNSGSRSKKTFTLTVPTSVTQAKVERLTAAGADVKSNITFGGVSYDYDQAEGKPVTVNATAAAEKVTVSTPGSLKVTLKASEGVVLHLS